MSCQRTTVHEDIFVEVRLPKSFGERIRSCGTSLCAAFAPCYPFWKILFYIFLFLLALSIMWSCWWIIVLVSYCQLSPGLNLDEVSIRNMTVYQNLNTSTDSRAWQVRSDINVNLTTWNRNTVAGCFSTYRRMVVSVHFKGELLLNQEVPLGFKLKPRKERPVVIELQGDGYEVQPELGSLLQVELRNASAVELQFSFETRFLRNDHKSRWMGMSCDVITTTPENSLNSTRGIVWSSCLSA